jgi:DNA repair protein RadC
MVHRIREMEPGQRPRERLLEQGVAALSEAELLAVLIRTGRAGHGVVGEAHDLLREAGGLVEVARMEVAALCGRPGIGPAKAATLAAAFELGRRLAAAGLRQAAHLDDPDAAGSYLVTLLKSERREVFGFLSLDAQHRLIRNHRLTEGTTRQAPVETGDLLRVALLDGAAEVLVYHNHPSGGLEPSRDDRDLTRGLARAAATVGVPLVDHLVVAGSSWRSLRRTCPELFVQSC